MSYKLSVKAFKWNNDNSTLFDYDSKGYIASSLLLKQSRRVFMEDNRISSKAALTKSEKENLLFDVAYNNKKFNLNFMTPNKSLIDLEQKAWLVLRHTDLRMEKSARLETGNFLKIGKIIFRIVEMKVKEEILNPPSFNTRNRAPLQENSANIPESTGRRATNLCIPINTCSDSAIFPKSPTFPQKSVSMINLIKKEGKICRICLGEDYELENPLISICKCSGTMKFIHFECAKQMLKSRITTKMFNYLVVHSFKHMFCELCKGSIPEKIKFNSKIVKLIDFEKPEDNYIILESCESESSSNRHIYILQLKERALIKLGRANNSDVRITDISVSRNHAILKIHNGAFYIEDTRSKFGTLVEISPCMPVFPNKQLAVQIGKTLLKIMIDLGFCVKICFKKWNPMLKQEENSDYDEYIQKICKNYSTFDQNEKVQEAEVDSNYEAYREDYYNNDISELKLQNPKVICENNPFDTNFSRKIQIKKKTTISPNSQPNVKDNLDESKEKFYATHTEKLNSKNIVKDKRDNSIRKDNFSLHFKDSFAFSKDNLFSSEQQP